MSGSTHVGGVHSEKLQKGCLAKCEDLISILSDDLISNILSRLPTKDALRTSVLSRDWEYKWSSISNIDIDDIDVDSPEGEATFYNFVERVLLYSLHVKSFRLLCYTPHDSNRLASWISGILRRKIEAFYFETKWDFVVPLKLTALCFENPSRICFPNLKSLTLYDVEFLNDNPIIDYLIFTFPVLETIHLHKCFWSDVKVVEFHAPEPTIFKFEGEVGDYTIIFNGGKLKKVNMSHYFPESINNCSTLRELNLVDLCFKVPARICFPNLMSLTLWHVEILNDNPITDCLFLTFPVLETINLVDCEWSKVKVVEIYAPELTVFKSHTMDKVNDYTISVFGGKLRVFEMSGYFPETIIVTGSQVTRAALLNWDLHLDEPFAARRRQRVRKILNGFSMQGLSSLLKLKLKSHFLIEDMVEPRFRLPLPIFDKLAKLSLEGEDGMRGIKSENLLEILNAAPCLKCLKIEASPEGLWHSYDHYEVEPVPSCVISHLSEVTLNFYERNPKFILQSFS